MIEMDQKSVFAEARTGSLRLANAKAASEKENPDIKVPTLQISTAKSAGNRAGLERIAEIQLDKINGQGRGNMDLEAEIDQLVLEMTNTPRNSGQFRLEVEALKGVLTASILAVHSKAA